MKPVTLTLALFAACVLSAHAQYPRVPKAIADEAAARQKAADQLSDEAFAKALPVIREWAARGKPYLPGAAEPKDLPQARIPAFPGAWGGGMYSFGGRGGAVMVVTNLNDSGPGSFREACEAGGPRIVLFNVAGIIRLKERIRIRSALHHHLGSHCAWRRRVHRGQHGRTGDARCHHPSYALPPRRDLGGRAQRFARRQSRREHHDRPRLHELGSR